MNKLMILSIAILSIGCLHAADDFMKKAVKKGQHGKIEAYVRGNMAISWEQKEELVELARNEVADKEKAVNNLSFGSRSTLANLEILTGLALIGFSGKLLHESYSDKEKKGPAWKGCTTFGLGAFTLIKSILGVYKDASKNDDAVSKLSNAKKTLEFVQQLKAK